jgi:hypothetical protein
MCTVSKIEPDCQNLYACSNARITFSISPNSRSHTAILHNAQPRMCVELFQWMNLNITLQGHYSRPNFNTIQFGKQYGHGILDRIFIFVVNRIANHIWALYRDYRPIDCFLLAVIVIGRWCLWWEGLTRTKISWLAWLMNNGQRTMPFDC